jgi:hypothetical protein
VSGDYLWDRSGPRDPDIVRLEKDLGVFAQADPPPALGSLAPRQSQTKTFVWATGLAAAVIALSGFVWQTRTLVRPGLQVTRINGTPIVGSKPVADTSELTIGRWLETDASARARIDMEIGQVEIDPDTRVGLLSTKAGDHRLHLARGTMHAFIWAPPGQFSVETVSSTAIDLGCAYTLTMDDKGVGRVEVTSGWVGFEWQGRESFIPIGAVCVTRPGLGPGTPHYDDVSPEFRAAIETLDLNVGPATHLAEALGRVLALARPKDAVTLWHLLSRVSVDQRDRVFDRLTEFVPPPASVTREGIRKGRHDMLDDWWDALGFDTASWWRTWKQAWREEKSRR